MPQFLRAHEMMPYVYNIADVAYPVSIRDQMNRARWIIDKARDHGFFGPKRKEKYRRLLVCGAGASGVTAALHAISLGIDTVLVEKSPITFQRQRLCRSRWIDPVQYDWSAEHWNRSVFPHTGPAMPLPGMADRSARLATRWHSRLATARAHKSLKFRRLDHALAPFVPLTDAAGNVLGVEVNFHSGKRETFGMVLWCVGFGDENRSVGPYRGFGFWETDPLERPYWGVASPELDLRGIVSGGGDGAFAAGEREIATG